MMNHKLRIKLLVVFVLFLTINSYAQTECKVLNKDIIGTYEGKCKKGLANGFGVAVGKDRYEGYFKKGLRNGKGKYITNINGKDTVIVGVWKKGNLQKAKEPKKYNVLYRRSVSNYRIRKVDDLVNRVTIKIFKDGNLYTANVNMNSTGGVLFNRFSATGFEDIMEFPFKCDMSYSVPNKLSTSMIDVEFRFEILEKGDWEVIFRH